MDSRYRLAWLLVCTGLVIAGVGLLWIPAPSLPLRLGRVPGEIRLERDNIRFYFPLGTCLLLSLVVNVVWWVIHYFRQ